MFDMKKKFITNLSISTGFLLLFIILIILLKTVDIGYSPLNNAEVGLSSINIKFLDYCGQSDSWYKITNYLGYLSFAIALFYVVYGIISWIKNKSIKKVDISILLLAFVYLISFGFYLFFELVVINYRPVYIGESTKLEASFPSSHALLAITFGITGIIACFYLTKNKTIRTIVSVVGVLYCLIMVIGRLLSGVHWFSDILGGLLLGISISYYYYSFVSYFKNKTTNTSEANK